MIKRQKNISENQSYFHTKNKLDKKSNFLLINLFCDFLFLLNHINRKNIFNKVKIERKNNQDI